MEERNGKDIQQRKGKGERVFFYLVTVAVREQCLADLWEEVLVR